MKKRITVCAVLFVFAALAAAAQQYYPGLGMGMAQYMGTTKDITLERAYNIMVSNIRNERHFSTPLPLHGKLSKRQSDLLWKVLGQFDYAAGEIYGVQFAEDGNLGRFFSLVVQIKAGGSCTWMGVTHDYLY